MVELFQRKDYFFHYTLTKILQTVYINHCRRVQEEMHMLMDIGSEARLAQHKKLEKTDSICKEIIY